MNLLQNIDSAERWFMLPPDNINHSIHLCTCDVNSASAPVITRTIEIHHSHHWFLRHSTGVMMRDQHPVLVTLPQFLHSGHDIKLVTDTIDSCYHCKGINDQKFFPLLRKIKESFMTFKVCM